MTLNIYYGTFTTCNNHIHIASSHILINKMKSQELKTLIKSIIVIVF